MPTASAERWTEPEGSVGKVSVRRAFRHPGPRRSPSACSGMFEKKMEVNDASAVPVDGAAWTALARADGHTERYAPAVAWASSAHIGMRLGYVHTLRCAVLRCVRCCVALRCVALRAHMFVRACVRAFVRACVC